MVVYIMNKVRHEWPVLFLGDIFALAGALYVALLVRYQEIPGYELLLQHYVPFGLLFLLSVVIFFSAGLYDKQTLFTRAELPKTILGAQIFMSVAAALLFFFVPVFGIAPKTNLVLYLIFSVLFVTVLRMGVFPRLLRSRKNETALIIARDPEVAEIVLEINSNDRYSFTCLSPIRISSETTSHALESEIAQRLAREAPTIIITDPTDAAIRPVLSKIFRYIFSNAEVTFIEFNELYESLFERVALSSVDPEWFLNHASRPPQVAYSILKRIIDTFGAFVIICACFLCMPFIWIAMRFEGRGPLFITQQRMGQYEKPVIIHKVRTMQQSDDGAWAGESKNMITRVGAFLRRTSIDELPQAFAVLRGRLSLIGPRSDMYVLGQRLAEAIPYYTLRYIVVPGITGWAQTHQRYAPGNISPQSIEESRIRLAYDLYYVKHRSILLDIAIALRTVKTLLGRIVPLQIHRKRVG